MTVADELVLLPDLTQDDFLPAGTGLVSAPEGDWAAAVRAHLPETMLPADETAWRGALALALLWDAWALPAEAAQLKIRTVEGETPFTTALLTARQANSLRLAVLQGEQSACVLGRLTDAGRFEAAGSFRGLADLLPERAAWFDRDAGCFCDPSPLVNPTDRALLTARLSALPEDARIAGFLHDLQAEAPAAEEDDLRMCLTAVYGLAPEKGFDALTAREETCLPVSENPLLEALHCRATDPQREDCRLWLWRGIPFAWQQGAKLPEPAVHPCRAEALLALMEEAALMAQSRRWVRRLSERLQLPVQRAGAPAQLNEWLGQLRQEGALPQETVYLHWPWAAESPAVHSLIAHAAGAAFEQMAQAPFADRLTCLKPESTLEDDTLRRTCSIRLSPEEPLCPVLPPLSAAAALCLQESGSGLVTESFRFYPQPDGSVLASFALKGEGGMVILDRRYAPEEIIRLTDTPTVQLWPAERLPRELWRAYFLCAQATGGISVCLPGGQMLNGTRQTAKTETYPACVTLHRDGLCLGALLNQQPVKLIPAGERIRASVDFGTSSTSAALRQGEDVFAAPLGGHVATLLAGDVQPMFVPMKEEPLLPSMLVKFTAGNAPLIDGCAGIPADLAGLSADSVFADLRPGAEASALQARRMYLHQVLLMTSFAAVLRGAPSITWRVALPETMSMEARADLWRTVCDLAPLAAEETGLVLTPGTAPVRHGAASLALGAYFREDQAWRIRTGCLVLDAGAGAVQASLWLRGMNRPLSRVSLPVGVQTLLMSMLVADPQQLVRDFGDAPALQEEIAALASQLTAIDRRRGAEKARAMLEALLHQRGAEVAAHMAQRELAGCGTQTLAQLTALFVLLMRLAGYMLEDVRQDTTLNDQLPASLPVCLTGRGTKLLTAMPGELQRRIHSALRMAMHPQHPTSELPLTPACTGSETALGLAWMRDTSDKTPEPMDAWAARRDKPIEHMEVVRDLLVWFRQRCPELALRSFPRAYDMTGVRLMDVRVEAELLGILARQHGSDADALAACLTVLCRA